MKSERRKIFEAINRQLKMLSAIYHQVANQHGISDTELWIWYALFTLDGDQSQQSICDLWSLPKQTVNSVVSGMIKKGYVYLESVPGTRNKKAIRLTEEGQKFGEQVVHRICEAEQQLLDSISPEEERICMELFSKYVRFLYKGIIIKHNKTEPTYTKTSLFLFEKRRFFMARTEKGGNIFKLAGPRGLAFFHLIKNEVSKWPMKK